MGKRFVVGDIHGAKRALDQCLERCGFDYNEDILISLGDVVDGWPESKAVVETLVSGLRSKMIRGNHDEWFVEYILTGRKPREWTSQGGKATLASYSILSPAGVEVDIPVHHRHYLMNTKSYYLTEDGILFVHGGLPVPERHPLAYTDMALMWDRSMISNAMKGFEPNLPEEIKRVFVGHTPVTIWDHEEPFVTEKLVAMDTGSGWEWKLSIMDVDSGEWWQSDVVADLYPEEEHGRKYRTRP